MTADRVVHFVVPDRFDDPHRASGGNIYDQRVAHALGEHGWGVHLVRAHVGSSSALNTLPDGSCVLVDGLVARAIPDAIESAAERLRIAVLVHMVSSAFRDADPAAVAAERRAVRAARHVIATSEWTRGELIAQADVPRHQIAVAVPGTVDAAVATGTPTGAALLCVGVVAPHKGQDVLIEALGRLDRVAPWTCTIAGSLATSPGFADRVRGRSSAAGLATRVTMPGVLTGDALAAAYQRADLFVAPSRVESSGMAIADALRRGIPVVATTVGGIPQTVADRAAILVPPGEPRALHKALNRWMTDPARRARLTAAAVRGRATLPRWSDTAAQVAAALDGMR